MRLIDGDVLRDEVLYDNTYDNDTVNYYLGLIDDTPTVEATPLTLEELRGMDGKPVWVEFHGDTCDDVAPCWMLVNCQSEQLCTDMEFVDFSDLGEHFNAYPAEPGREDREKCVG